MSKRDYIWAFKSDALTSGPNEPFSLEYHVSGSHLKVAPEDLVGSRTWLVMKENGSSFLYAVIVPSSLEQYQEGLYKDDFLISANAFCSMRFLPRQESKTPWLLPSSFDEEEGIRECTEAEKLSFADLLSKNHRSSFAPLRRTITDQIPRTEFKELQLSVPDQLAAVLRLTSFGDLSRPQTFPSAVSVFGGLALEILKQTQPEVDWPAAVELMALLDPMSQRQDKGSKLKSLEETSEALRSLPPLIDTFLEEIDPEKIAPRIFVARSKDVSLDWLDKTNYAEESHERILKDVVLELKKKGYKTMKSRSFDLVAEKTGTRLLFEIKSSNKNNLVAQAEKGIVQLLRYSTAISERSLEGARSLLLLQNSGSHLALTHLSKMAERAHAELWLYDEKTNWPGRVQNIDARVLA